MLAGRGSSAEECVWGAGRVEGEGREGAVEGPGALPMQARLPLVGPAGF
jgi:hypothetical protein